MIYKDYEWLLQSWLRVSKPKGDSVDASGFERRQLTAPKHCGFSYLDNPMYHDVLIDTKIKNDLRTVCTLKQKAESESHRS